ncbi:hypothetical protein [Shumkonia mesophila]|uniref:hypothetical protein n=1 Tax=Shumkonia mesophila TaxID=2838854 RepID=UPI002934CF10|nr:hypothetical protein [Shumkonia mesophila]
MSEFETRSAAFKHGYSRGYSDGVNARFDVRFEPDEDMGWRGEQEDGYEKGFYQGSRRHA